MNSTVPLRQCISFRRRLFSSADQPSSQFALAPQLPSTPLSSTEMCHHHHISRLSYAACRQQNKRPYNNIAVKSDSIDQFLYGLAPLGNMRSTRPRQSYSPLPHTHARASSSPSLYSKYPITSFITQFSPRTPLQRLMFVASSSSTIMSLTTRATQSKINDDTTPTKEKQRVKCTVDGCLCTFSSQSYLLRHLRRRHKMDVTYPCPICNDYNASSIRDLRAHIIIHTGEKPFICPLCPELSFSSRGNLLRHLQIIHPVESPDIIKRIPTFLQMERFLADSSDALNDPDHPWRYLFNDDGIDSYLSSLNQTASHSSISQREISHTKKKSENTLSSAASVLRADSSSSTATMTTQSKQQKSHDSKSFFCSYCPAKYALRGSLRRHMAFHHSTELWSLAGLMSKSTDDPLNKPRNSAPSVSAQPVSSSSPSSSSSFDTQQKQQETIMSTEQQQSVMERQKNWLLSQHMFPTWPCYECNATFYSSEDYKAHLSTHVNVAKHQCPFCSCAFDYPYILVQHMNMHPYALYREHVITRPYIKSSTHISTINDDTIHDIK